MYDDNLVEVIGLNLDASPSWLTTYANITGSYKSDTIHFALVFDSSANSAKGATFAAYGVPTSGLWPAIFLVDQNGLIQLRYYTASDPAEFWDHLEAILTKIDDFLANPPEN